MTQQIEVGDIIRLVRYTSHDAGRHFQVTSVAGDHITGFHGAKGGRNYTERGFHRGDVVLVRKRIPDPASESKFPFGKWAYAEQFPDLSHQPLSLSLGPGKRHVHAALDGGVTVITSFDEVPGGQYKAIAIHTNEVPKENPNVKRLEYTVPPKDDDYTSKLEHLEKEIEKANHSVEKLHAKWEKWRDAASELRRERDKLKVEAEKTSIPMPVEPEWSRFSTVIKFTKSWSLTDRAYEYAAIRGPGLNTWSVTGDATVNGTSLIYATWEQILQFIQRDEKTYTHRKRALDSIRVLG